MKTTLYFIKKIFSSFVNVLKAASQKLIDYIIIWTKTAEQNG